MNEATLSMALQIVNDLATFTEPTAVSIFPRDLNTSNFVLTNTLDLLYRNLEETGITTITDETGVTVADVTVVRSTVETLALKAMTMDG